MQWRLLTISVISVLSVCGWGCASSKPIRALTSQEKTEQANAIGSRLSLQLEEELFIRREAVITAYLNRLAQKLAATVPDLRTSPLEVFLFKELDGKWQSYGLPGNKVYLSTGLLKTLEFENEVAAVIAIQLAHIQRRNAIEYFVRNKGPAVSQSSTQFDDLMLPQPGAIPTQIDYFGPGGVFAYSESRNLSATEAAIDILYRSGYDPRGLVSVMNRMKKQPNRSPYEGSTLDRLIENARRIIALHAPLRNPIVRSPDFLAIEKRMKQL